MVISYLNQVMHKTSITFFWALIWEDTVLDSLTGGLFLTGIVFLIHQFQTVGATVAAILDEQ